MRRLRVLLVALMLVFVGAGTGYADQPVARPAGGFAAVGTGERIGSYENDMELRRDGSVRIVETIDHVFPAGEDRHGITRDIRLRAGYRDRDDVYRYYRLTQLEVSSPSGAPAQVQESDFGAYLHLRIGSPDATVSGRQTYVIAYTLADVVNVIDTDSAEFVHDIVGIANEQWYDEIAATVRAPAASVQAGCNYGAQGADSMCEATSGSPATFRHTDLQPGEAMTVAVSLPRSAFDAGIGPNLVQGSSADHEVGADPVPPAQARLLGRLTGGLGLFLPLLALAAMSALVWTRGRDEQYAGLTPGLTPGTGDTAAAVRRSGPGTVAVQFNPPPGVQPGLVGTLIDESADTVDVTATLLDLAVRGHLSITETEKAFGRADWLLTRQVPTQDARSLSEFEELLLEGVFAEGPSVQLSQLKNTFATTLASVRGSMYTEVVRRGWFRQSPQSQRTSWSGAGSVTIGLGIAAFFFLGGSLPAAAPLSAVPVSGTTILAIGLVVSGLIIKVLGRRMAARTADGSAVLAQSLGFRQYLVTAEAGQIRFEEAQQIFSRFLPYAIVFGVAQKWADTFQEVAAAAAAQGVVIAPPLWYIGPGWGTGGMFDSVTSGVDDFATNAAGTFISTPGSSGESVFSGGGGGFGGGFSGGGGSGSSGGSW